MIVNLMQKNAFAVRFRVRRYQQIVLIRDIKGYMFVRKTYFSDPIDIALTAPTGLATRNISGQTLHSAFMFSVEHHGKTAKYTELSSSRLQRVRREFDNLK